MIWQHTRSHPCCLSWDDTQAPESVEAAPPASRGTDEAEGGVSTEVQVTLPGDAGQVDSSEDGFGNSRPGRAAC